MVTVLGAAPIIAPALGSALIQLAGWRAVYGILALVGGLLWLVTRVGVAETRGMRPGGVAAGHTDGAVRLRNDGPFMRLALANALSYGVIFAYIAGAPVVIIGKLKLSSLIFSSIFACTAATLTAGAWSSGRLSRAGFGAAAVLGPSLGLAAIATITMAVISLTGTLSAILLLPPLLLTVFTRGTIAPNLQHLAVERWPEQAGVAAAAIGVSQLLSGALTSAVVAILLPRYGLNAVTLPMALLAVAALAVWCWTNRRHKSDGTPRARPT